MKQIFIFLMMLLPLAAQAQDNTWEKAVKVENPKNDPRYLAGAVPEVDGRVTFETTIKAPGKSADQIYDQLLKLMTELTKTSDQLEQSRIALSDKDSHQIIGSYQEWMVFKNKPLNLDRTRMFYTLVADCKDGEATVKMTRINYFYDEERNPTTYKAEEWITDRYGLNKKQTKLSRVSGKFRMKTIDRKDYLFGKLQEFLNQ